MEVGYRAVVKLMIMLFKYILSFEVDLCQKSALKAFGLYEMSDST